MQVEILLNIIDDIIRDEGSPTIQELLKSYLTEIEANILSENAQNLLIQLEERINSSAAINFTYSETKILKDINATKYFGEELKNQIENFKRAINPTSRIEFSDFLTDREITVTRLSKTKAALEELKLSPYFSNEHYEIGVLIPREKSLNATPYIEKQLHTWNLFFKDIERITWLTNIG